MLAEKPPALSDARRLSQRVHFEHDGTVSIASGKVELGQGILTALAQIAAEELGVELARIRMLPASTAHSPDEGVTSGSQSISEGGRALRVACAEVRALLLGRAARLLGTESSRLTVEDGTIRGPHNSVSYWELAHLEGQIPGAAPLQPAASYRIVGTSAPRARPPGQVRRPRKLRAGHGAARDAAWACRAAAPRVYQTKNVAGNERHPRRS